MEYNLKDKIPVTAELLNELSNKSWQEIDNIQAQIANIADTKIVKLLNNLLTSYYVFVGALENLSTEPECVYAVDELSDDYKENSYTTVTLDEPKMPSTKVDVFDNMITHASVPATFEPFEYFVDFDEPTGDALTDEDLYNV